MRALDPRDAAWSLRRSRCSRPHQRLRAGCDGVSGALPARCYVASPIVQLPRAPLPPTARSTTLSYKRSATSLPTLLHWPQAPPPCRFPGMSTHLSPSTLHAHGAGDTLTCVHILLSVLSYPRQWTFSDHVSERSRRWQRLAFAGGDNKEEATSMMTYGSCCGGVCEGNEATTTDPT
ncbi:uncharacterized protein [Triticum aestivum]|uniref:uncharacterized protein n=1 Tax=Triticum aestivum TaxID=4565 RepID=UPI001D0105B2|nr:uncharacterized protein LOC123069336 [Triticum aestivum]